MSLSEFALSWNGHALYPFSLTSDKSLKNNWDMGKKPKGLGQYHLHTKTTNSKNGADSIIKDWQWELPWYEFSYFSFLCILSMSL